MAEISSRNVALEQVTRDGSYVDWGCALAGAALATAISLVLYTFGSGIGLSLVSPWSGAGISMVTFAIIASLWAVLVQVSAFAAGGYLAGRMRRPWADAKPSEVEFRDGVHGALVWAIGVSIGALLLASTAGGVARSATDPGNTTASRSAVAMDPTSYAVDKLFRSARPPQEARDPDLRAEAARLLATGIGRTEMTAADRTYLTQLVAARTGLGQPEAGQRVTQVLTEAKDAADRPRKLGIVAAFLAAASLLAGCAAAWSAARLGGSHRDQGTIWRGFARHAFPTGRATPSA